MAYLARTTADVVLTPSADAVFVYVVPAAICVGLFVASATHPEFVRSRPLPVPSERPPVSASTSPRFHEPHGVPPPVWMPASCDSVRHCASVHATPLWILRFRNCASTH